MSTSTLSTAPSATSRRQLLAGAGSAGVSGAMLALAACGVQPTGDAGPAPTKRQVTVRVTARQAQEADMWPVRIPAFNEAHPNVRAEPDLHAGNIVEKGSVRDLFKDPQHPYTEGLLESMPRLDETEATRLQTIGGQPPNLQNLPSGCSFRDRCRYAFERCPVERPVLTLFADGRSKACHLPGL